MGATPHRLAKEAPVGRPEGLLPPRRTLSDSWPVGGLAFPVSEYLSANYGYPSSAIYMAVMALTSVVSVLLADQRRFRKG